MSFGPTRDGQGIQYIADEVSAFLLRPDDVCSSALSLNFRHSGTFAVSVLIGMSLSQGSSPMLVCLRRFDFFTSALCRFLPLDLSRRTKGLMKRTCLLTCRCRHLVDERQLKSMVDLHVIPWCFTFPPPLKYLISSLFLV